MRNHDLVVRGSTTAGESVVICVEAKAGESLGESVEDPAVRACRARDQNVRSQALERLNELVERLCRYPAADERVRRLRYQLLTAWAGTLTDAQGTAHAVFALHEFRTDRRCEDKSSQNRAELDLFANVVLGSAVPAVPAAWCTKVPDVPGIDASLYLAHIVTDLRTDALRTR